MVNVVWTETAIQDLNEIGNYIAKDSLKNAKIIVAKIFNSTKILKRHPHIGTKVVEINDENIRQLIEGNYRIVYQNININQIEVLTIHNTLQMFLPKIITK